MTRNRRRFGRLEFAIGLAHALALVPHWLLRAPLPHASRVLERRFMARLARRLVTGIRIEGAPDGGPGTLYIANHVSWLDIPVLGSALDANFISKADVQNWPLIGRLARRTGTIFIVREARHQVERQSREIEARLRAGDSLILFPEGTTSDGSAVQPFHSSLFEAAQHAARIQPLAIAYVAPDGAPFPDAVARQLGWAGAEPLGENFARVVAMRFSARIRLAAPWSPLPGESRKQLAARCHAEVAAAHASLTDRRGA